MNKKILTKTLLPIASIALIGGGIASSLVACSKKQKVELVAYQLFNSKQDIYNYINKNASHPSAPDLTNSDLSDSIYVYNSSSLSVGANVQRITFPYSYSISESYTINFGTQNDVVSLQFTDGSIVLVDGDNQYTIYSSNTWQTIDVITNKFTIYKGEYSGGTEITLAYDYTKVFSYTNTLADDGVSYYFNGWYNSELYTASAWNYYLNNFNDTNVICSMLYDGLSHNWDYIRFEELKDNSLDLYFFYYFYEGVIDTIQMFYKDENGNYYQGSGTNDFKKITKGPYSAPYHGTVFDEEESKYVLENNGNFIYKISQIDDNNLVNPAFLLSANSSFGEGTKIIVF